MPLSRSSLAPMLGAFAFSLAIGSACAQTAATTRLQGEIVAVDQAVLRIRTATGQVTPIAIDKARVTQRVPMHLDDVNRHS